MYNGPTGLLVAGSGKRSRDRCVIGWFKFDNAPLWESLALRRHFDDLKEWMRFNCLSILAELQAVEVEALPERVSPI